MKNVSKQPEICVIGALNMLKSSLEYVKKQARVDPKAAWNISDSSLKNVQKAALKCLKAA